MSFYNFFFVANRNGSETSQKLPNESPPQKHFQLARDLLILMDSNYLPSSQKHSAIFFENKCCFPDQEYVGHYINKITETGLDFFTKYLLRAI